MDLSQEEQIRYARHLALPEVGMEGQKKLKEAKVLVVGAGGLGCPALLYLAAAGVGTIGIIDHDTVEESNLQRQVIYSSEDIGKSKAEIAQERISKQNPHILINAYNEKLTKDNAEKVIQEYDIVIDGSDNFPTRYTVNDACVFLKKPLVYGAVFRFEGQISVFNYKDSACYRCLSPMPPSKHDIPNCAEAGVLGIVPGIIGTMQASEAIKIILEKETLAGTLMLYNALVSDFQKLELKKNSSCPVCSEKPTITELQDFETLCSTNESSDEISVHDLKKLLDSNEDIVLIDAREPFEQKLGLIGEPKKISFTQFHSGDNSFFELIEKNKHVVVYCHTGQRSAYVVSKLKEQGFSNVQNLVGGIDSWSKEIDSSVPVY